MTLQEVSVLLNHVSAPTNHATQNAIRVNVILELVVSLTLCHVQVIVFSADEKLYALRLTL